MNIRKIISVLYNVLFFSVPLVLYPYTSELFEFNKMVVTYILTVFIAFFWSLRMITEKKIIFRKTFLDIPILIFLGSQVISTLISVDIRTSIFGYYSRFNGGLVSLVTYSLLYWGFVSNLSGKGVISSVKVMLISTLLSSIYGILERFGIDKDVWVQDVQNRVFSTFGQPNWLAAWLAAVLPISLGLGLSLTPKPNSGRNVSSIFNTGSALYLLLSCIFFVTLLFTKSRSGILGFAVAISIFWVLTFISTLRQKLDLKSVLKPFVICNLLFVFLVFLLGSPWTPSGLEALSPSQRLLQVGDRAGSQKTVNKSQSTTDNPQPTAIQGPALEVGGSSSVEIRKIVWQGALDVWKNYPLFGSGVETFAFSYYQFRPVSHNLVSEWDFLYNKAHNEYLNFMATTGSVGILTYIFLILSSIYIISNTKLLISNQNPMPKHKNFPIGNSLGQLDQCQTSSLVFDTEIRNLKYGLLSGYISILITNFFGFSVVPVNLLFFLFPAMAIILEQDSENVKEQEFRLDKMSIAQKTGVIISCLFTLLLFYFITRYWYADISYNKADIHGKTGNLIDSVNEINRAIKLSPNEAIYHDELGSALADIAIAYLAQDNQTEAEKYAISAMKTVTHAESLSPKNLNIIRNYARIAIKLSEITPSYILDAKKALLRGIEIAPTEAKLYYNLALTYYRIGDRQNSVKTLQKTIEIKPNYKDARYAYAIILAESEDVEGAVSELEYILEKIDPEDENAKKTLNEIRTTAI